jgi:6,7-dimethyl-8-ribityllumazine synthase
MGGGVSTFVGGKLIMDTTGKFCLAIAIVILMAAVIAYSFISKKGPYGAVLAVGAVVWFLGRGILSMMGNVGRETGAAISAVTFSGFVGVLLGVMDVIRKYRKRARLRSASHSVSQASGHPER